MKNISELLRQSELRTGLLTIANDLQSDVNYTKEDAVEDILKFLKKHGL